MRPSGAGQGRDEQAVITAGDRAGNSAGGVTAEAIGHEPFAIEQNFARRLRGVPRHRARYRQAQDCVSPFT